MVMPGFREVMRVCVCIFLVSGIRISSHGKSSKLYV